MTVVMHPHGLAPARSPQSEVRADERRSRRVSRVKGMPCPASSSSMAGWSTAPAGRAPTRSCGSPATHTVQNPTTSLADDVAVTKRALDQQPGQAVLVGPSHGGAVITEAGNHPKVAALVYIAAFAPDGGESMNTLLADPPPGAPEPPSCRQRRVPLPRQRQVRGGDLSVTAAGRGDKWPRWPGPGQLAAGQLLSGASSPWR